MIVTINGDGLVQDVFGKPIARITRVAAIEKAIKAGKDTIGELKDETMTSFEEYRKMIE